MESTNLQTPDDALSYIAPIGEFVPYTCHVTASHPTIRTRVRSLQRRWLLFCLSEIGQTLLLFSCCLASRVVSLHLTSHHPKCHMPKLVQSAASLPVASDSGSWVETSLVGHAVESHRRLDAQVCLHRLLHYVLGFLCSGAGYVYPS